LWEKKGRFKGTLERRGENVFKFPQKKGGRKRGKSEPCGGPVREGERRESAGAILGTRGDRELKKLQGNGPWRGGGGGEGGWPVIGTVPTTLKRTPVQTQASGSGVTCKTE